MELLQPILESAGTVIVGVGLKAIGAIILWFIGRRLIGLAMRMLTSSLKKTTIEATLLVYLKSTLEVLLNIVLVVSILGFFGVQTTSFAAFLAAAGIAIGAAWSGLLAHFAAGAFLVIFRPFSVGDFITAAGVTGTVEELGLFVTTLNTLENVRTIVPNNEIFGGKIENYSSNPYRRVDLLAQLNHDIEPQDAIARLREQVSQIPNVIAEPQPDIEILEFNLAGPVLAVRPYCNNAHYWQVYFDTNRVIREAFGEAQYAAPSQHLTLHQKSAA